MAVALTSVGLRSPVKSILKLRRSPAPYRRIARLQHDLRAGCVTAVCT